MGGDWHQYDTLMVTAFKMLVSRTNPSYPLYMHRQHRLQQRHVSRVFLRLSHRVRLSNVSKTRRVPVMLSEDAQQTHLSRQHGCFNNTHLTE